MASANPRAAAPLPTLGRHVAVNVLRLLGETHKKAETAL